MMEQLLRQWEVSEETIAAFIDNGIDFTQLNEKEAYLKELCPTLGPRIKLKANIAAYLDAQEHKINDKTLCEAAHRLTGMLGEYIKIYNDLLDILRHNLQVQKTEYMNKILQAVVSRILELKHQTSKLTGTNHQYLGHGLVDHKLTTNDVEFAGVPHSDRPEQIKAFIENAKIRAKEEVERREREKEALENAEEEKEEEGVNPFLWEEEVHPPIDMFAEKPKQLTEEELKVIEFANLIKAQEKTRQVIKKCQMNKLKRSVWEKALMGELPPPAPLELRRRAAEMIQDFLRQFFELKRKRIADCKRDEQLMIRMCKNFSKEERSMNEAITLSRIAKYKTYEDKWKAQYEEKKLRYYKKRAEDIAEDYRDNIRDWYRKWYEEVRFFYDIPNDTNGGSALILKGEVPTPTEWSEKYKKWLQMQKANKAKSAQQRMQEKLDKKREQMMLRREKALKEKQEAALMRKLMKNPTQHPGYTYPASKKTESITTALDKYHEDWDELDFVETLEVKEKAVKQMDDHKIWMDIKIDVIKSVDADMRQELKLLRKALKEEYEKNEEEMPAVMQEGGTKRKKKAKLKTIRSENISEKMQNLIINGVLKEYPKTKLEDFIGDPNFAGDDYPCFYEPADPFNGQLRHLWWEKCRELVHGHHKLLVVGPKGSGKTKLVHIMATANDAVFFEIDFAQFTEEMLTPEYVQDLVNALACSAKAVQPSLIYIKHIHKIYYSKDIPEETNLNQELRQLLQRSLIKKLSKSINNLNNITIVGSCIDPWLTKSSKLLKEFPNVVLMPLMSYSNTVQLLKHWVLNNRMVPKDLDIHSLAYVLRGYSFGFLYGTLQKFLSAEQIVKIAAKGLSPEEVYDFILQNEKDEKPDYNRYQKWYADKTHWGQKEKKHTNQQREYKIALQKYAEKGKKKKKTMSAANSMASMMSQSTM